ncbi:endonuclease/exonuclease/phosphatase family protein [Spirosoma gilvum]
MLAAYTCLAYWLLYSLQIEHWSAGMIMISIPIVWGLNLVVVCLWLTSRPWRSWLSGLVLILGVILLGSRTFVWHSPVDSPGKGTSIKVFSYNVHQFSEFGDGDKPSSKANKILPQQMLNFVLRYDAPIKCFQEAFTQANIPAYDLLGRFEQAGYAYTALLHPEAAHKPHGDIGIAIFSKFPIIASGQEVFDGHNGLVWANIKIGKDTIRVINVHLHSMGIRVGRVLRQNEMKGVQHETRGVLSALRLGFINRNDEVRQVEKVIRLSPYPVIVTGDHNDTPYSVVYERMRRVLPNSFEDAGRGFGFSYNRLPKFIRIDHQFHDPKLPVLNFETINTVTYSDHYPIAGTYLLK